jgi:hypothetical protein
VIAVPDTILVVKKQPSVCHAGYFNSEARSPAECISCFCFSVTTDCRSADLFTYQVNVQGGNGMNCQLKYILENVFK